MRTPAELTYRALEGIPEVRPGDDLPRLIGDALVTTGTDLRPNDVVAVAQKIVSKSEDRLIRLETVTPSARASKLARLVDKDPRVVELILSESVNVLRAVPGVLITENRYGLVMANAGLDMSNVEQGSGDDTALLLPRDPDASAERLRVALQPLAGGPVGVIVCDSVGRAWREATVGLAIGVSGVPARLDLRGEHDRYGRKLKVSEVALADSLAAGATLVMGERDEGRPASLIRGLVLTAPGGHARDVVRPREKDLFR